MITTTSIHFSPKLDFETFLDDIGQLLVAAYKAEVLPRIVYGSGNSEKDALSRPIDLSQLDEIRKDLLAQKEIFSKRLIARHKLWSPELPGVTLMIEQTRPPSNESLNFAFVDTTMDKSISKKLRSFWDKAQTSHTGFVCQRTNDSGNISLDWCIDRNGDMIARSIEDFRSKAASLEPTSV